MRLLDHFNKAKEDTYVVPFTFKSTYHQRYENGTPKMGLQKCLRTVTVEKNTNGCRGYKLEPGIGYIVKIYNDDLGKPNMSDKPMKVISKTDDKIELRGFPIEAQTPFGWQEVDYRDYGLTVYYKAGEIEKCVLHMFDRDIDIEYRKSSGKHSTGQEDTTRTNSQRKLQPVSLSSLYKQGFSYHVERYEEWQAGSLISSGQIVFDLHIIKSTDALYVEIPHAEKFRMRKSASFSLFSSNMLSDRLQYTSPNIDFEATQPIILHVFVKGSKIDCVRFAMTNPDRIVEFYGYQIESAISQASDSNKNTYKGSEHDDYKLTFLSSLVNVAACDGEIVEEEMRLIVACMHRDGLSEKDLSQVVSNPKSIKNAVPNDANLRAQHLRDVVALAMVDGSFSPEEYSLCKRIAIGIGFKPEVIDVIRKELNDKIGANI